MIAVSGGENFHANLVLISPDGENDAAVTEFWPGRNRERGDEGSDVVNFIPGLEEFTVFMERMRLNGIRFKDRNFL